MIRGILLVFLGACSYGILSTFAKLAYRQGYTSGEITGTQSFFGMLFLWMLYLLQSRLSPKDQSPTSLINQIPWWEVLLAGLFIGFSYSAYYKAVSLIPASIAIVLLMNNTWMSMLLDLLLYKKRPTPLQLLAVLLILGGTAMGSGLVGANVNQLNLHGVLLALAAAFFSSVFMTASGRLGNDLPPLKKSALLISGAVLIIFTLTPPLFFFNGVLINGLWRWAIIFALFGMVIPTVFFAVGVPRIGVALGAILNSAELPVAVILPHVVLHETVLMSQWVGILLILGALVLANAHELKHTLRSASSG
jgi:drug/metabolite transporter (DMT)-like permease